LVYRKLNISIKKGLKWSKNKTDESITSRSKMCFKEKICFFIKTRNINRRKNWTKKNI